MLFWHLRVWWRCIWGRRRHKRTAYNKQNRKVIIYYIINNWHAVIKTLIEKKFSLECAIKSNFICSNYFWVNAAIIRVGFNCVSYCKTKTNQLITNLAWVITQAKINVWSHVWSHFECVIKVWFQKSHFFTLVSTLLMCDPVNAILHMSLIDWLGFDFWSTTFDPGLRPLSQSQTVAYIATLCGLYCIPANPQSTKTWRCLEIVAFSECHYLKIMSRNNLRKISQKAF